MSEIASAYVSLMPSAKGFGRAAESQIAPGATQAGKKAGLGLGTALKAGAVVGIAAVIKGAVGLEAKFSQTMNTIGAVANVPKKQLESLSDLAIKMGADTVFSANEASDAMLELAKGGISAADISAGALKGTLTLAAAGGTNMATAATIASNAMNTFSLKGNQMGEVAAALAGGANASSASVESLGEALSQVGPGAKNAGLSLQETVAALSAFDAAGIKGSDAGTSLKTMLARLVPQTDKAQTAMKAYGLSFVDAHGNIDSLTQISAKLKAQLGGLSQEQRTTALATLFGSDATRAASVLMEQGAGGIRKYIKATQDQDAAQRVANARMQGSAGAIEAMKGSLETVSLVFGRAIEPLTVFAAHVVADIANGAVPIIQSLGDHLRGALKGVDLGGGIKRAMGSVDIGAIFQRIGAAIGGIDWAGASAGFAGIGASLRSVDWGSFRDAFGQGVSDTISVFSVAIGFAAAHLDTFAKLLPALVVAFVAYKTAQAASNVAALAALPIQVVQIASNLALAAANRSLAAQMAITSGVENVGVLTRIRATVATVAGTAASLAAAAATKVMAAGQWLLNAALTANPIGLVIAAIAALAIGLVVAYKKSETFRAVVQTAFAAVKVVVGAVVGWLGKYVPQVFGAVAGAIKTYVNVYKSVVTAAFNGIRAVVSAVMGFIGPFVRTQLAVARAAFEAIKGVLSSAGQAFGKFASAVRDKIGEAIHVIQGVVGKIKAAFSGAATMLYSAGADIIRGLINGIKGMAGQAASAAVSVVKNALASAKGALGINSPSKKFAEVGMWSMVGLRKGIDDNADKPVKAMESAMKRLRDSLEKQRDNLKSTLDGIKSDFASLADSVSGAFAGNLFEATTVDGFFKNALGESHTLRKVLDAFKKLRKWGLPPAFLSKLFASGNTDLILAFASGIKGDALAAATTFDAHQSLTTQLGNGVARNQYGPKLDRLEKRLDSINDKLQHLPKHIGRELNGAVAAGHRKGNG